MKSILVLLICVLSYCQAGVTRQDPDGTLINNKPASIPAITEITTAATKKDMPTTIGDVKASSELPSTTEISKSKVKVIPGPPETSESPNSTTITPPTTSPTTTAIPTTKTTEKPSTSTEKPTPPTKSTTTDKPTTPTTPSTTTVKPTDTPKPTTQSPKPSSSTEPNVSTTPSPAPAPSSRGFNGPSFIGGIVLASGLMAIGFVAFKFYRARTELNYHTL